MIKILLKILCNHRKSIKNTETILARLCELENVLLNITII